MSTKQNTNTASSVPGIESSSVKLELAGDLVDKIFGPRSDSNLRKKLNRRESFHVCFIDGHANDATDLMPRFQLTR